MATWTEFAESAPEMAELGERLRAEFGLAFLATIRKDGSPRLHPVCPFVVRGRLFIATHPESPKRLDLARDGRYVIHALPGKDDAEFLIRGIARRVTDDQTRASVGDAAGHTISDHDWIFEYDIQEAMMAHWENVGQPDTRPVRKFWRDA